MHSLKTTLAALQREIEEALAGDDHPRAGVRLYPDRVVVSLQMQIGAGDSENARPTFLVAPQSDPGPTGSNASPTQLGPSLTIEFRTSPTPSPAGDGTGLATAGNGQSAMPHHSGEPPVGTGAEELLVELLGRPGFDSSARATVFRETVEELSEDDLAQLCRVLESGPVSEVGEPVRRARHLLLGLVRSGPLKDSERGIRLLSHLLRQHSPKALAALVLSRWKTQDDWLD